MARVFVRLKLALLANGFRRGWQQAVGIVVAAVYALPIAALGARGLSLLGRRERLADLAEPLLVLAFVVVWAGWVIGPLLAFGMDETLDPGRLRLLPLRRRQLMAGLLAASTIGIGPLATATLLAGVIAGFTPTGPAALVVIAAAIVQFTLCITTARAVTTALSRRLSSRRGRDLLTVFAALIGLLIAALAQLPRFVFDVDGPQALQQVQASLSGVADRLVVLPPAWPARAVVAAAEGNVGAAVLWLLAGAGAVAVALWWWTRGLERAFDTAVADARVRTETDLFPALLAWLPRTRLGAGVSKDVRYAWRVPQLRVQYLVLGVMLIPTAVIAAASATDPMVVTVAPVALLLVGTTGMNLFGADRGAVWMLDATGPRPRTDLLAKSLVAGALGLPVVWLIAAILALVTGGWAYVPATLLVSVGVAGIVGGVGMVVSVLAPFPLPESPTNVFAANAGAGCAAVVLQGLALLAELVLIGPIAALVAIALLGGSPPLLVAAAAAVLVGSGAWWAGLAIATRRLTRRAPEFVAALQPRAS